MELKELLLRLSESVFIPGSGKSMDVVATELKKYASHVYTDTQGNLIGEISPVAEGMPHIMLDAHIDEIGFTVTAIDDDGFLKFDEVGGPDPHILLGQEVMIHGKQPVYGVVCCQPPHLLTAADYKKSVDPGDLAIDIGFDSEKARELVSPGDFISLCVKPAELKNGFITGKSLDDRCGVAVILRALELLKDEETDVGLTVVFSSGEELGERGARTAAYEVAPSHAFVVDASFAMTPDAPKEHCGVFNKGPMIGISPILPRALSDRLLKLAKEYQIPCQKEIMGSSTGTNSDVISVSREGVAVAMASVPLRFMHTGAETISVQDVEDTARLCARFVLSFNGEEDLQ